MFAPDNSSAHRFLSDAYIGVPRREIARVSELLQAQMLQDININPVQPSLAETNLSLLARGGPFIPGLNEYTPLFERNDVQFVGAGLAGRGDTLEFKDITPAPAGLDGKDDTLGFEGIASALYNRFSISAGAFHYDTDGWRPNAGFEHEIYNFFMQAAVTPDLNVQVEFRHRESQQGDLSFNFDPEFFNPNFTRLLDQDTGRIGVRYSPSPNADLLLSFIGTERNEQQEFAPGVDASADSKGRQAEAQYIQRLERINLVAGFAQATVEQTTSVFGLTFPEETEYLHGYVYTNVKLPDALTWTFGVSSDNLAQDPIVVDRINPKLGVRWDISDNLSLRAAMFQWVKPPLVMNRTLEPTQVSGFNQVFDDADGDASWRRGVGLDWRITKQLFVGAEATSRNLTLPITQFDGGTTAVFEKSKEQLHRGYLYWAPTTRTLAERANRVRHFRCGGRAFDRQWGARNGKDAQRSVGGALLSSEWLVCWYGRDLRQSRCRAYRYRERTVWIFRWWG